MIRGRGYRETGQGVNFMGVRVSNRDIKERFKRRGFSVTSYARAYGLSQPILSWVLAGREDITGGHKTRGGVTRKVFMQLKKDGVWVGPLPWEVRR